MSVPGYRHSHQLHHPRVRPPVDDTRLRHGCRAQHALEDRFNVRGAHLEVLRTSGERDDGIWLLHPPSVQHQSYVGHVPLGLHPCTHKVRARRFPYELNISSVGPALHLLWSPFRALRICGDGVLLVRSFTVVVPSPAALAERHAQLHEVEVASKHIGEGRVPDLQPLEVEAELGPGRLPVSDLARHGQVGREPVRQVAVVHRGLDPRVVGVARVVAVAPVHQPAQTCDARLEGEADLVENCSVVGLRQALIRHGC